MKKTCKILSKQKTLIPGGSKTGKSNSYNFYNF